MAEPKAAGSGQPLAPVPLGEAASAPTPLGDAALALGQALALLRQAGQPEPEGDPSSADYLQGMIDQLVDLSSRDPLTGLANRRSFELALARELDRVARSGEPALLLVLGIDAFQPITDAHGHGVGDAVIQAVGLALSESVRPMDLVARIGGDGFAVLLPNCQAAFGPQIAGRIRMRVARRSVPLGSGHCLGITVSVGGAFAPQWVRSSGKVWLQRADVQLMLARGQGRDRVCFEPVLAPEVSADEKELLIGGLPLYDTP